MGRRNAQRKTNTRPANPKPRTERWPDLNCPCCGLTRDVRGSKLIAQLQADLPDGPRVTGEYLAAAARSNSLAWACDDCLETGRATAANPNAQTTGLQRPILAYWDQPLRCADCGADFVFAAHEQAYWYETLGFVLHAQPKRCVPCRRERRQRKFLNLELSEQWANFSGGISELVALADTYEAMRNTAKALACLRQAKNKTRSDATRQTLQRRIEHLEHPSSA